MKKPSVSIVIPTFNRASTIERSVKSVLEQTFDDIEVIVVDDGSTDDTEEVMSKFSDSRIKYLKQSNAGACAARNKGIDNSSGQYIAFQDSDDFWHPDKLEKQLLNIEAENSDFDICFMNSVFPNGDKRLIPSKKAIKAGLSSRSILESNFISTQMILAKRSVFDSIRFDERLPRFQDWDLGIRMINAYKMSVTKESLVDQYILSDSITTNPQKAMIAFSILESKYCDLLKANKKEYSIFLRRKVSSCKDLLSKQEIQCIYRKSLSINFNIKSFVKLVLSFL